VAKSAVQHRVVHYWSEELAEPLCGSDEDFFQWSDERPDVTCEPCLEALERRDDEAPAPSGGPDDGPRPPA
jgi:hypothetical protein